MSPKDFKCWLNISSTTRDIRVIDNKTIVTLACKINSFPSPAVLWNYHNGNKHSVSFSMESSDTYWSNLTIIAWTIEDYGQYVCAARNYELTEEKSIDLFAENLPFNYNQTTTSVSMNNEGNITSTTEMLEHNDEKYLNNHMKNESSTTPNHNKRTVTFEKETLTDIIVTVKSEAKIQKQPDHIEDLIRVHLITDKVLELENKTTSVNITEFIITDQNKKKYTDSVEIEPQLPLHLIIEILFCLVILLLLGIIITKKIIHKPKHQPVKFPRILIQSTTTNRRYSSRLSQSTNLEQGQNLLQTNSVPVYSELYAIREATS